MFLSREGRTAEIGQRVRLYRNLHNGKFSIKDKKSGKVLGYCDEVTLENVDFVISKAGQERARREQRRNVHAYAEGDIVSFSAANAEHGKRVTYHPFERDHFYVVATGEPIERAARLYAAGQKIYIE